MGGREDGLTQAFRHLEAMEGQDDATRLALWKAAKRYANRDKVADAADTERSVGRSRLGYCRGSAK